MQRTWRTFPQDFTKNTERIAHMEAKYEEKSILHMTIDLTCSP